MILELDCGNSFIKWRVIHDGAVKATGVVDTHEALARAVSASAFGALKRCRLVSVRSEDETVLLIDTLRALGIDDILQASPARQLAGVKNGYVEYERLGLDRWLALVGAYSVAGGGGCLVMDFGTAVTSDFVAADGQHLGGFICPGMALMRNQLRTHTRRIRYDDQAAEKALHELLPGRATAEAVERGCALMLRGLVQTQIDQADSLIGGYQVFLTGGDAELVADVVPVARVIPDLVFLGLAIACPFD